MTGAAPGSDAVVLVEGSDATLVADAVSYLLDDLLGSEDRSLALEDYAGDETDLAAVADACATPPFLTGRRVVVVRDVGRFNTEEVGPLLTYLDDPLPTTSLVLVAGGGPTAPKLAAAVKARGRAVSTSVDSRQSGDWIRERLRAAGLSLDRPAEERLRVHLGEDISRLVPLIAVLEGVFGPGATLTFEDIEPYIGTAGSVTPWAFTDAIDAGDGAAALSLLHRLLEGGERHPLVVLAVIHRHVQSLLKVDGPLVTSESEAAVALGIPRGRSTFPAKKALRSARQWGSANIAEAIGLVADAEVDLKGAGGWPERAVLEVLVARLCRLSRGRPAGSRTSPPPAREPSFRQAATGPTSRA